MKAGIPRDDAGSHDVEIPTPGTPLLAGVREAGSLHPLSARRLSKFSKFSLTMTLDAYYKL